MAGIHCKRCGGLAFVRNGIVRGHQRYRCSDCGCNFTDTPPRGKPPAMKALAILLYAMGNASLGMIARLLGVSNVAVLKWVRQEAMTLPEPTTPAVVEIVQFDETVTAAFVNGKNKRWIWRAFDPIARRTLAWVLGDRDDRNCKRLLAKVGIAGRIFLTDDWKGYHRCIPAGQLFTGKDLTFGIEQDNGNVRHYLARFRRRSKVSSRSDQMVDLSLRLLHRLAEPTNYLQLQRKMISIFR